MNPISLSNILLLVHQLNSDVNKNRQQSLTQPWIIWESIKSRNRSYKRGELLCSKHNSVLYFKSFFIKTTRWSIMVINFILRRMTRRKKFYLLFNLMRFTSVQRSQIEVLRLKAILNNYTTKQNDKWMKENDKRMLSMYCTNNLNELPTFNIVEKRV